MTTRNELPAAPRELSFGVNETRLLGEVGLFFSSATAAFAECVQNAYRAGATTLRVTADPSARKVVFRDNGCGLSDPSKLLQMAESGWDTADVKHAAGLGSLALFAIATDVEIISMPDDGSAPWRIHFTDAALRHEAPVECWDAISPSLWAEHGDEAHGVEIRATLRESATFPTMTAEDSGKWRHRFPLAITIEVADSTIPGGVLRSVHTVGPREGYSIETSAGALHVTSPNKQSGHFSTAIFVEWEHRRTGTVSIPDEVLSEELCIGVPNAVREELIRRLRRDVELVWVVSPNVAVEAKLPDRETLVRDEGFKRAMSVLAATLLAEFDVENLRKTFVEFTKGEAIVQLDDIEQLARGVK